MLACSFDFLQLYDAYVCIQGSQHILWEQVELDITFQVS
jgi:hypothetical protein